MAKKTKKTAKKAAKKSVSKKTTVRPTSGGARPINRVGFQPQGDRVLVKPEVREEAQTASGIYIPDTAKQEKPERGTVVAVGAGKRLENGDMLPVSVSVGDVVLFSKYGFDEITIGDTEYFVVNESSILGVIK